jgi:OOP family OmpA-OmpF porin
VKAIAIFISFFLSQSLYSQLTAPYNLVSDSSFENNKFIPTEYSCLGANGTWNSPTRATTDLFSKAGKKQKKISRVDVPTNGMGKQEPHSGKSYAGLFACSHGYYREYMQTLLKSGLEPGKEYILSMYVSLADYSQLAVDKIGICLTGDKVRYENSEVIRDLKPMYIQLEEEIGTDTEEWHKLELIFKAKGGETNLLVGAFAIKRLWKTGNPLPPRELASPINRQIERDAYYYFDDISLYEYKREKIDTTEYASVNIFTYTEVPDTESVEPVTIEKVETEMITAFKKVLFQSGSSVLQPVSFPELDVLAIYLKGDLKKNIEIFGHTDNAGDENKNIELSTSRAKAVADYLIARGLDPGRVTYKGFGSSKPIDTNDTEEGRKENRRVEFKITRQ